MLPRIELREHREDSFALSEETAALLAALPSGAMKVLPVGGGRYLLSARQHVGTVVTPDLELRIQPKCGPAALIFMLAHANGLERLAQQCTQYAEAEDLREFLLVALAGELERLLRLGLRRSYVERDERLAVLRGRVLFGQEPHRLATDVHLPCRHEEFTLDQPANQVLRYTLETLAPSAHVKTRQRLIRVRQTLRQVSSRPFTPREIGDFSYDRLDEHYRQAHRLCRLLLEHGGVEAWGHAHRAPAFLVDMDKLFERFVASRLRDALAPSFQVSTQWPGHLDTGQEIRIRPDLVISHRGRPLLVADTKYKQPQDGRPSSADAFQALAYAVALGLERSVLIYAADQPTVREYRVRGDAATLATIGLEVSGTVADLAQRVGALTSQMRKMLS